MVIGWVIVRKIGRVGDGNSVDGNDGSDGNGVILEVACVGFGLACGSCVVLVVLYKRDRIGSDVFDPSKIERVSQIPSVRACSDALIIRQSSKIPQFGDNGPRM